MVHEEDDKRSFPNVEEKWREATWTVYLRGENMSPFPMGSSCGGGVH